MKKIIYLLAYIAIAYSTITIAMEKQKMNLFVIPGSNNIENYVSNIFSEEQYNIANIGTPFTLTFPYQTKKHYEETIKQTINKAQGKSFLYALGDGVPFAFDYAAKNSDKVAGILAEGTIYTDQWYLFDLCTKISPNIPIIFIHNTNDEISPCDNIIALFHHLNTNTARKQRINYYTTCLTFVGPNKTNNDHKNLKNTEAPKNIHNFLRINNLNNQYNLYAQKKSSDIEVTIQEIFPHKQEQDLLNKLIIKENIRYYKDWAIIIIPVSFLTSMLLLLLYKSIF
jgi:hypothetical protein